MLTTIPEGKVVVLAKVRAIICPVWKHAAVTDVVLVVQLNPGLIVKAEGKVMTNLSPL
jgi:hypothetical protein